MQKMARLSAQSSRGEEFVEDYGALRLSGRRSLPSGSERITDAPLLVAVHGGTYTSAYFDLAGYSLVARAGALGVPLIALDRPGYGQTTPLEERTETIDKQGDWLNHIVGEIYCRHGACAPGIVLIGHSVGAATVVEASVLPRKWPLLGIAISGICLNTPQESKDHWAAMPDQTWVEMTHDIKDAVMFGPPGTFADATPTLSHEAHSLVPRAELLDIVSGFPSRVSELLPQIGVPVHYRQGEHDPLWITDSTQVETFAGYLRGSPLVDAGLFMGVGHCIDLHRLGASFHLEQLAFTLRCGTERAISGVH
jgi:pimeloyl-ACP methyl ester carboxylesterase